MGATNSRFMNFLNKAENISMANSGETYFPADAYAAACMMWPSKMIKESVITNVTPVIDGAARGGLLVDYSKNSGKKANTEVVLKISKEYFQQKLYQHLS